VLVTGGAGDIGSVITDQLLEAGHRVIVLDDLSNGHRDAVVGDATFVQGRLQDAELIEDMFAEEEPDAVVHMASSSLAGDSIRRPAAYYHNNVVAGIVLLDAMRAAGVDKIVFASTAAIYGEPVRQPIAETDPLAPTNPYGETKLVMERALHWHHQAYGLRSVSLRCCNAAGATARRGERHDPETHLIPLVLAAAGGSAPPVTVFGDDYPTRDGTCVRDYVHVSDVAQAHVAALEALDRGDVDHTAFNLGSGTGCTVREIIDAAARVTGRHVPATIGPRRPGDAAVLVGASDRIRHRLGWVPQFPTVESIVDSAWQWMRSTAIDLHATKS
jgi:UDP-glucose 4-epimerase